MTSLKSETVGVIDVGSNTIKLLVATRGKGTPVEPIDFLVEETRIGEGMTGQPPIIDPDALERGTAAIARLAKAAAPCDTLCIVATSAVRDASNKGEFVNAVERASGHELRILSGEEEATLIGQALKCDPALSALDSYSLLDLGGGSLECIHFLDHQMMKAESLKIGSVRLASLLVEDRSLPLSAYDEKRIANYVHEQWSNSSFQPNSSPSEVAVLTGGAAKHLASNIAQSELTDGLSLDSFRHFKNEICATVLADRSTRWRIPPPRADIFPTALVTLDASLRYLGCRTIYFSEFNLRFGVAALLLEHGYLHL